LTAIRNFTVAGVKQAGADPRLAATQRRLTHAAGERDCPHEIRHAITASLLLTTVHSSKFTCDLKFLPA
jgi:hypothetical protein